MKRLAAVYLGPPTDGAVASLSRGESKRQLKACLDGILAIDALFVGAYGTFDMPPGSFDNWGLSSLQRDIDNPAVGIDLVVVDRAIEGTDDFRSLATIGLQVVVIDTKETA